uniref:Uncharacterized protein n=1 Tax=Amazona collaria TaxID=241587 RepID=A0A8B9FUD5_9PSIT
MAESQPGLFVLFLLGKVLAAGSGGSGGLEQGCAKPAEIEHGYVEHLVKYHCDPYYQLRGAGDGEAQGLGTAPKDGACPLPQC